MEYPVTVIPSEGTREAKQRGGRERPSVDLDAGQPVETARSLTVGGRSPPFCMLAEFEGRVHHPTCLPVACEFVDVKRLPRSRRHASTAIGARKPFARPDPLIIEMRRRPSQPSRSVK